MLEHVMSTMLRCPVQVRDGRPLSYAEARSYFKSDPALKWVAALPALPLAVCV